MNARQATDLKGVLGIVCPGATDIQVKPESDGASIILSGVKSAGNSEPGGGDVRSDGRNGKRHHSDRARPVHTRTMQQLYPKRGQRVTVRQLRIQQRVAHGRSVPMTPKTPAS